MTWYFITKNVSNYFPDESPSATKCCGESINVLISVSKSFFYIYIYIYIDIDIDIDIDIYDISS